MTVTVKPGIAYTTAILDVIKGNIENYIDELDIGVDVSATGILTAITAAIANPAQPSFSLASISIGETGGTMGTVDVPIDWNAVASVGTVSVTEVT